MALGGLLGAGLGLLIMFYPADAAIGIIWLIAGTAILLGLLLVLFAWKLRGAAKRIAWTKTAPPSAGPFVNRRMSAAAASAPHIPGVGVHIDDDALALAVRGPEAVGAA